MDRRQSVRMADVAAAAGVSAQTVSRVLAGHPNVRTDTRERVQRVVEQLGYRVNTAAATLASGRAKHIGVIMHSGGSYSLLATLAGIERTALEAQHFVSVALTSSLDPEELHEAYERLLHQGATGIVLCVPNLRDDQEEAFEVPVVSIDGAPRGIDDVVTTDQHRIGTIATEYLLGLGHATVWHVAGPLPWNESLARERGWADALAAAGVAAPPAIRGDWTPGSGAQLGALLARTDATAVFVASDELALGVIHGLRAAGKRIPEDVSIVGVDDVPFAAYMSPPLTTVRQPFEEVGEQAVRSLLSRMAGEPIGSAALEPELVIRASTVTARN